MHQEGKGRNKIARLLAAQSLHVSEGSVGNIIRAYQKEQSLKPAYANNEQSLQCHSEIKIQPSIHRNGGPLSHPTGKSETQPSIHRNGGSLLKNDSTEKELEEKSLQSKRNLLVQDVQEACPYEACIKQYEQSLKSYVSCNEAVVQPDAGLNSSSLKPGLAFIPINPICKIVKPIKSSGFTGMGS